MQTPIETMFIQNHFMASVILLIGLVTCIGIYRRSLVASAAPSCLFFISMVVKEIYSLIWHGTFDAEMSQNVHEWLFVAGFLTATALCVLTIYLLKSSDHNESNSEV